MYANNRYTVKTVPLETSFGSLVAVAVAAHADGDSTVDGIFFRFVHSLTSRIFLL